MSTKKREAKELEKVEVVVEEQHQPEKTETLVYVGESLPGGALQKHSLFKNGVIPGFLQTHIEKCPAIKELIVPVASLPVTRIQLMVSGSRENTLNSLVQKYIRGEK